MKHFFTLFSFVFIAYSLFGQQRVPVPNEQMTGRTMQHVSSGFNADNLHQQLSDETLLPSINQIPKRE